MTFLLVAATTGAMALTVAVADLRGAPEVCEARQPDVRARILRQLDVSEARFVDAIDLAQDGRTRAGPPADLEAFHQDLTRLAAEPPSEATCVAIRDLASGVGFVDDDARRRALFAIYVATGTCADALTEPGRFRPPSNIDPWEDAAVLARLDPALSDSLPEAARTRLDRAVAAVAARPPSRHFGIDVRPLCGWDPAAFDREWRVETLGVPLSVDPDGLARLDFGRHDVRLVHADGSPGPTFLVTTGMEEVFLSARLVVARLARWMDGSSVAPDMAPMIEAWLALGDDPDLVVAVVRKRGRSVRVELWSWVAGERRFDRR